VSSESFPSTAVPRFSAALEAAIDAALATRLDRAPTDDERAEYRQVLWAFASAINGILDDRPPDPTPHVPIPHRHLLPQE